MGECILKIISNELDNFTQDDVDWFSRQIEIKIMVETVSVVGTVSYLYRLQDGIQPVNYFFVVRTNADIDNLI